MNKTEKKKFRLTDDKPFEALRILVSILITLLVTFIVLCIVSNQPGKDFISLLTYPFKNPRYFGYVLVKFIPLTFAGLATRFLAHRSLCFSYVGRYLQPCNRRYLLLLWCYRYILCNQ